jgi:hypothetical protein
MKGWLIVIFFICIGVIIVGAKVTMFSKTSDNTADNSMTEFKVQVVNNNIRLTMSIENDRFRLGENIGIKFEIKNERTDNISSLPFYSLDVYDENHGWMGWTNTHGHEESFDVPIEPGESYSQTLTWNQEDQEVYNILPNDGIMNKVLEGGVYYIQSYVYIFTDNGYIELQTPLLEIKILA